jgi:hypothetical protein
MVAMPEKVSCEADSYVSAQEKARFVAFHLDLTQAACSTNHIVNLLHQWTEIATTLIAAFGLVTWQVVGNSSLKA